MNCIFIKKVECREIHFFCFLITDAHKGMAIAGALALGLSAVVGVGFALSKAFKK